MQYLLGMLAQMKSYLPVDSSYLNTLLKMLGITYVGQFSAGICKDAGYSSIAGQIELFARLAVLAVSMPVLLALLETVHDFCKKPDGAWRCFSVSHFGTGRTQKIEAADTETDQAAAAQDELLAELDFDAIQQEVDSLLSSQQFSFAGTVRSLLQDGDPFRTFRAGNAVLSCAKTAFLAQKGLMKELFLLVLAGAVLGSFPLSLKENRSGTPVFIWSICLRLH